MKKERVVKAVFSNGETFERGSLNKVYTHAWLACGKFERDAAGKEAWNGKATGEWNELGFSGSELLAKKALHTATAWRKSGKYGYGMKLYTVGFEEVVAVVEIAKRGG